MIQKTKIFANLHDDLAVIHFMATSVRDTADVQKIVDEIEEIAYNNRMKALILNFARLRQLTSAFLSKLIGLHKSLEQAGITLRLCGMAPQVEEAFRICQLHKIMPLFKTEEEAIRG